MAETTELRALAMAEMMFPTVKVSVRSGGEVSEGGRTG